MKNSQRVAVFIDGWNFGKATYEGLGIKVDFKRLLEVLVKDNMLLKAYYYIGEWTAEGYALFQSTRFVQDRTSEEDMAKWVEHNEAKRAQQQGFIRMLNRNGYQVVSKPVKVFADGTTKADLDIDLAIDMLTLAERCDKIILVSGDGDFAPVVRAVGKRGVRVEVVTSQQREAYSSRPDRLRPFPARGADELLDAADEYTDLAQIAMDIALKNPCKDVMSVERIAQHELV